MVSDQCVIEHSLSMFIRDAGLSHEVGSSSTYVMGSEMPYNMSVRSYRLTIGLESVQYVRTDILIDRKGIVQCLLKTEMMFTTGRLIHRK